jgi:hypothetical protein
MDYEILNTTLENAIKEVEKKRVQRLSVDFHKSLTNLEIIFTPIGNYWDKTRLTGTDDSYVAISIVNFGCYPFILDGKINAGYLATKLNLPFDMAEEVTKLLNNFKINFYDER